MRYLITGGAGFIGGHLSEFLIGEGHSVTVIDNLSTGSLNNIKSLKENPAFDFVEADILDYPGLDRLVSGCDMIFHLAAAVGVELVVHDPVRTIITNVHGTERVLEAASKSGTEILVTSTSEVYGKSPKTHFSEQDDLLIGAPTNSRWSYACSKLLDEFLMMAFHRASGLPVIVVRLFNTVGPRQTGRYGMVLPRFVASALKGEELRVYGTGEQTRCFCHVADVMRAFKSLSGCEKAIGGIFNIGSTQSISMNALAELVIKRLASSSSIAHIPYEKAYEKGFEDMMHRIPDTNKIHELTGWKPQHQIEKIIDDTADFIRADINR